MQIDKALYPRSKAELLPIIEIFIILMSVKVVKVFYYSYFCIQIIPSDL